MGVDVIAPVMGTPKEGAGRPPLCPESLAAAFCSTILAVKERFLRPWRRFSNIFNPAMGNMLCAIKIAV
jgi:hypothetical protein